MSISPFSTRSIRCENILNTMLGYRRKDIIIASFLVLLMVSVNVVNIIRIIMNTQVNGENHKEHTMQFLFLCIYARGWGDHNELNRVFSQCWCCVFNGWGFLSGLVFDIKSAIKLSFNIHLDLRFDYDDCFACEWQKCAHKKTTDMNMNWYTVHRTTCTLSNQAKLHQRALFQHTS